jgi:hypothetical protein
VKTSLNRPTSITAAAITGATWRFIDVPETVERLSYEEQKAWVTERIRRHFLEAKEECTLFGNITGYVWHLGPEKRIDCDTEGNAL